MLSPTDAPAIKTPYGHRTEQTKSNKQGPCQCMAPHRTSVWPYTTSRTRRAGCSTQVAAAQAQCSQAGLATLFQVRGQQRTTASEPMPSICTANGPAQYPLLARLLAADKQPTLSSNQQQICMQPTNPNCCCWSCCRQLDACSTSQTLFKAHNAPTPCKHDYWPQHWLPSCMRLQLRHLPIALLLQACAAPTAAAWNTCKPSSAAGTCCCSRMRTAAVINGAVAALATDRSNAAAGLHDHAAQLHQSSSLVLLECAALHCGQHLLQPLHLILESLVLTLQLVHVVILAGAGTLC